MPGINAVPRRESRSGTLKSIKGSSDSKSFAMFGLTEVMFPKRFPNAYDSAILTESSPPASGVVSRFHNTRESPLSLE